PAAPRVTDFTAAGPIQSFAVQTHAGGDDQLAYRPFGQRFQQYRGADVVDAGVVRDFIHALAHADGGGVVEHHIDTVESACHGSRIAYIAHLQIDLRRQVRGPLPIRAVNLGRQTVEHAHGITLLE